MGQAQINVRTRACSGTFIARTKQAALTHNVRGKELISPNSFNFKNMNPKNTKKSLNHENADANITCIFRDGDISSLGIAYLTHAIDT